MRHFDLPVTRQSHNLCFAAGVFGFLLGTAFGWFLLICYLVA